MGITPWHRAKMSYAPEWRPLLLLCLVLVFLTNLIVRKGQRLEIVIINPGYNIGKRQKSKNTSHTREPIPILRLKWLISQSNTHLYCSPRIFVKFHLSRDMWFSKMWDFDKCRLRRAFKLRNSKWCSVRIFKQLAMTLIRRRICAGWSEALLVA